MILWICIILIIIIGAVALYTIRHVNPSQPAVLSHLPPGDTYDHQWGYTDTRFEFDGPDQVRVTGHRYALCGYTMPHFLRFVEEMLGLPIRQADITPQVTHLDLPEPMRNEAFLHACRDRLSADQLSLDGQDRLIHSHGQLSVDEVYHILYHQPPERLVDVVLYPQEETHVQAIIEQAHAHNVCLVPYGGGTNVSGALAIPPSESRMVASVDMRRMNRIVWLDETNLQACVEAGISGQQLEQALNARGYTCGHEPDSLEFSTLGGWIATNASGMKKNRYGNIEDIVLEATLHTPTGVVEMKQATPRYATGMPPRAFLFGSEGNFGIITKAIVKIHPTPECQQYGAIVFPTFQQGTAFLKALRLTGQLPASIRLVNNNEFRFGQALKPAPTPWGAITHRLQTFYLFKLKGFDVSQMVACTVVMEGSREAVRQQTKTIFGLAKQYGGLSGGASNGQRGYMLTFGIAYIRDFFNQLHILGETFETSVPWSQVHPVCQAVETALAEQCAQHGVPGKPYLSYRITQLYHTGVCIYFTMGFCGRGLADPSAVYHQIERHLRQVILHHGGSLSHHHGVGKIRQDFLSQIQTANSIALLHHIKQAIDPKHIFAIGNGVFKRPTSGDRADDGAQPPSRP